MTLLLCLLVLAIWSVVSVMSLIVFSTVLAVGGTNAFLLFHHNMADFEESIDDYKFVFHNDHNLLLVLRGDKCYFFPVRAGEEWVRLNAITRDNTERFAKHMIEDNNPNVMVPSDEAQMRVVFGDVLADFRCTNHTIFYAALNPDVVSAFRHDSGEWDPFSVFDLLPSHLLSTGLLHSASHLLHNLTPLLLGR